MKNDKVYFILESFNSQNVVRAFSTEELVLNCANRICKNFWENYADKIPDCSKDELIQGSSEQGDYIVSTPKGEIVYKLVVRTVGMDDDVTYDFAL